MGKLLLIRVVLFGAMLVAGASIASAQFDGDPPAPQPLAQHPDEGAFDIQVHSRDKDSWFSLESMQAQHGANCAGPPAAHESHSYEDAVFVCKEHVMTALNATGYGVIYLTPARTLDLTTGSGIIQWDMSTERMSARDWPDVWVTPWEDNIPLPFDEGDVDLQTPPRTGVHVNLNNGPPIVSTIDNFTEKTYNQPWEVKPISEGVKSGTNQSAARQTFRLTLTPKHVRFERLSSDSASAMVFFDGAVNTFPMTKSVVQFGHHSYNPTKDKSGVPATWHWDNFSLTPSDAFTLIKADKRYVTDAKGNDTIQFAQPAPSNSYLRFSGAGRIEYSVDDGATWSLAPKATATVHVEHMSNYFFALPAGVQKVKFRFSADDWYNCGFGCIAKDFALFSQDQPSPGSASSSAVTPKLAAVSGYLETPPASDVTLETAPTLAVAGPANASNATWQDISPPGVSKDFNNPPDNFGFQIVAVDPTHPGTLYLGTSHQGIWKSTDSGDTWARADKPWAKSCGTFDGRVFALTVDPTNGDVYATNGYGCAQGLFKSTDGGVQWSSVLPSDSPSQDVNRVAFDPNVAGHLLASFHSNHHCPDVCDTPIAESFDYGETWKFTKPVPGAGWGQWVFFLNDSGSWLAAAENRGLFRTTDSGKSWTKVSSLAPQHGNAEMVLASTGAYLLGSVKGVLRSTDDGATWAMAWPTGVSDGVHSLGGDGTLLLTRSANTGNATTGPLPYVQSIDGGNSWTVLSGQTLANGPMSMAYDAATRYLFSSNWNAGVFRLQLEPAPSAN